MKIGLNGSQDVLALLVRRKFWVLFPFLALSSALAVLIYVLPRTYVSETLILVRPRDIPQDFVKDLIAGSPEERLKSIQQTILSRTNLLQILREFGDKLPEYERLNMDDKVLKLRNQINILFEVEKSASGKALPLTYFRISYQNQNPELAQKIAGKLTTLFIEQDNKTRETQVFGTTEFLSAELEKVSRDMNDSEEKMKLVKSTRQFELPDQLEANLRTLDRLGAAQKANSEALDRYAAFRLAAETQLSQTPPLVPKSIPLGPTVRSPQADEMRKVQAQFDEYHAAETQYDELASRYTAKHPEVAAAKARLERLKAKLPADLPAGGDGDVANAVPAGEVMEPNPLYQKMAAQLQEIKTELSIREREKTYIESEIVKYNTRVENAPKAEQDISEVVRVNTDLKKQYDDLKNKLAQARLAESLESKQKGSQFVIVDPANYPLAPAKPNKGFVLLGSALGSLVAAMVFAGIVDIARQRIWTQSQIEALWGVPVLIDIPEIVAEVNVVAVRKKMLMYVATGVAAVTVYSFFLYGLYLKQGFVLQQLDPIIQKLVYK